MIKKPKYGNKKTIVDGIKFDSLAEANRYSVLLMLQKAGKIQGLELQPSYQLAPKVLFQGEKRTKPALKYRADFSYSEGGKMVIEDVKGVQTPEFRIKRHFMASIHGIHVKVTK